MFNTGAEERRAWIAERPDARHARTGETARGLIDRRALGLAPRSDVQLMTLGLRYAFEALEAWYDARAAERAREA